MELGNVEVSNLLLLTLKKLNRYHHDKLTNCIFQIIDDDSGLGGFGADIDFSNNKLIKDRVNVQCMNQCFE